MKKFHKKIKAFTKRTYDETNFNFTKVTRNAKERSILRIYQSHQGHEIFSRDLKSEDR